jgi:hypothetical protein
VLFITCKNPAQGKQTPKIERGMALLYFWGLSPARREKRGPVAAASTSAPPA